jgi:hypothetical protein
MGLLIGARALQGVFGALLAPAALALLSATFTDPADRGKAFGVFGAIGRGDGPRRPARKGGPGAHFEFKASRITG